MNSTSDLLNLKSKFNQGYIKDYQELKNKVRELRERGLKITLTSGSFDCFHTGHGRYLKRGKELGDILIVGVDSDQKIRKRKGQNRPIDPEEERLEILLCHCRHVDFVILKKATDPRWGLIKTICPDFLLAIEETYSEEDLEELKKYCDEIIVVERQAPTSTSAKIRKIAMLHLAKYNGQFEVAQKNIEFELQKVNKLFKDLLRGN